MDILLNTVVVFVLVQQLRILEAFHSKILVHHLHPTPKHPPRSAFEECISLYLSSFKNITLMLKLYTNLHNTLHSVHRCKHHSTTPSHHPSNEILPHATNIHKEYLFSTFNM